MLDFARGMRQVQVEEHVAISVFPDFSDPNLYYYLPNFPHIAKMEDGTPAIRLVVYRKDLDDVDDTDPDLVAFLSLDVDLSWDPALINRAASKLQMDGALANKPRLTPIFFSKGSVKLLLLDAASPEDDSARPAGDQPSKFVNSILGAASPSLYGDCRAIFQASLPKKGAAALAGSLDGVTPIGVVYSLTFAGLQPAFRVKANVDWQKVYDHFSTREHLNLIFVESDIQKSIDKLVEKKVITFDVTVEGIGAAAMDAERETAMTSIRQLIFDKFFEATLKPVDAAGGGTANDIVDTLTHLARNGLTLGLGYSYSRKEVNVTELRSLDIDWTARKAVERTIYPQAHMHNLVKSGVTKEKLVTIIDGAEKLWKVLPFQVMAAAAWETDGIAGITVDIEYKDADSGVVRTMSVFLDKTHEKVVRRDWMDRTSGSQFHYKYEVVFMDGAVPGPRQKVNSGKNWIEHQGSALVINPRDLYELVELEVATVQDFPFNRWPAVQAIIRYRTNDGKFEHYEDGVLKTDNRKLTSKFRIDSGVPGHREVQLNFIGATGERVLQDWAPMPQDQWVVSDPHSDKLTIRAIVAGDRKNISNLLVDLDYSDDVNGIHESGEFAFDPDTIDRPASWTVNLADPANRRYRYRMTLVTKDGEFLQTGWISTDSPSLAVGEAYVRLLTVDIVTGALGPGIEAVEVAVAYDDTTGNVHDAKTFRLGPKSRSQWQVKLQDASNRSYKMTTTWIRPDGFNPKVGPVTTSETYIVVPGQPPR
jgi:hypothetical protein